MQLKESARSGDKHVTDKGAYRVSLGTPLTSMDTTTGAVACHDVGEFVRLHPVGKRMCMKMGIKASVRTLMAHPDREVA